MSKDHNISPQKRMYEYLYGFASEEIQLSWHREEIPIFLKKSVELLNGKGNALDIGCGTGINAAFMAQAGLQVTALDFIPRALDFARSSAGKLGVNINFVHADVIEWKTTEKFELILDSGCLHSLKGQDRKRYKEQILNWMSHHSNYILIHFGKKHYINFSFTGPIRKNSPEIELFFSPELQLKEIYHEKNRRGPLYHYWFINP